MKENNLFSFENLLLLLKLLHEMRPKLLRFLVRKVVEGNGLSRRIRRRKKSVGSSVVAPHPYDQECGDHFF